MKLDYWILWFEDTKSWLNPIIESLKMDLDDIGFRLRTEVRSNGDDLSTLAADNKYDLILMDYNLKNTGGSDIKGDELIRQIRLDHKVFTEVVFYSVNSVDSLREAIYLNGRLDGVYCFNRNDKEFENSIIKVIDTTVKKVLDTNNMRGIAMASIANCDQLVINAVVDRWGQLEGDAKDAIRAKALEKLSSGQDSLATIIENLESEIDLRKILESHAYPSATRFYLLNSITKSKRKCNDIGPIREKVQNYPTILEERNRLGHAKALEEDGKVIFEGHDNIVYDSAKFQELRKSLISHEEDFSMLQKFIAAGKLD